MTGAEDEPENLPALRSSGALSLHRMLMPDREADHVRAQCMSGGEWEYGRWLMLNPPSPDQRERLTQRHRAIASNLSHHDQHVIAAAVADVIACYRNFVKKDEDPKSVITKYVKELAGIPTWACVRACDTIRNCHAPGISLEYPFSTMQLRALAESYVSRLRDEATEISQIMRGGRLPPPASPELRAKLGRNLARLAFQMRASRKREDDAFMKPLLADLKRRNDETIIGEYRHRGEAPVFAAENILVSPQLLDQIKQRGVSDERDANNWPSQERDQS